MNDGHGRFEDATDSHLPTASGDEDESWTTSILLGDVDGDEDLDLFCGNTQFGFQNRLYQNDGSGRFTDVTRESLPPLHVDRGGIGDMTWAAAFGDVDGDDDLDLVCGNGWGVRWQRDRLYLNHGSGRFVDASAELLPEIRDRTDSLVLSDIDGDGDLDLISGNARYNHLLVNDGAGRFSDVTATHLGRVGAIGGHAPLALADVDLDGDADLFCLGEGGRISLFVNNYR